MLTISVADLFDSLKPGRFALLLGAGASRSSGIPTSGELIARWLVQLWMRSLSDGGSESQEDWKAG